MQSRRDNRQPDPAMKARSDQTTAKSRETLQKLFDKARARPAQPSPPPQSMPATGAQMESRIGEGKPETSSASTSPQAQSRSTDMGSNKAPERLGTFGGRQSATQAAPPRPPLPTKSSTPRQNASQPSTTPGGWGAFSGRTSAVQAAPPRPPPPPAQPSTSQQEGNPSTGEPPRPPSHSSWGAFSRRQSPAQPTPNPVSFQTAFGGRRTSEQASSPPARAEKPRPVPPRVETPAVKVAPAGDDFWDALESKSSKSRRVTEPREAERRRPQVEPVKPAGDDFWDELQAKPKQPSYTGTPGEAAVSTPAPAVDSVRPTGNDFWDGFDGRVGQRRERRSRDTPRRAEEQSEDKAEKHKWTRRSEKKKTQNSQERAKRYDDDDADWDVQAARYERKKAKEQRKKQQQMEEFDEETAATPIFIPEYVSVSSLGDSLSVKVQQFLADLEEFGFEGMTADTLMTGETASLVAMEYGFDPTVDDGSKRDLRPRPIPEDITSLPPRPPIVTIMGHVDHGKTTLLDYLRKSSVAAAEHGGITQHIGAFVVKMSSGKPITFLDTPGHAAFLTMRQRGANVTDIVVLVVAADDSVKPQTLEALKHAQSAKVPIIVAINKIDKDEARIDQVKGDLARHGVEIEDYGGDVQVVCVSGRTGQGMEDLEENINTLSEILDTRSEPDGMAEGWILESSVKQDGKVATVLVKRGTLKVGDHILAGRSHARVRILRNEAGAEVLEAGPGTPVEILGWRDLPEAGEQVLQAPDESAIRTAIQYREEMADRRESSLYIQQQEQKQREKEEREAALAAAAAAEEAGEEAVEVDEGPKIIYQNFVVKADVAGSVEAVVASVQEQGNNEVQSKVLRFGTGQVSEYDVDHAATSKSIIVNFNNSILPHIKLRADQAGVRVIDHSVIYHLTDEVRSSLSDLLPKAISHKNLGEADILQVFPINIKGRKYRNIAGCRIRNGSIKKTSLVKVIRWGAVVYEGKLSCFNVFM